MTSTATQTQWLVVFTSKRRLDDLGYQQQAERMETLARSQPGFVRMVSVRQADGHGITLSYWNSAAAIAAFKSIPEHLQAQQTGRTTWYDEYTVDIAQIERSYQFKRP